MSPPFPDRPKFLDDIAGVAGGALSAAAGLREEMAALVRARVEEALRRLDLVRREEFDAMAEVAARARAEVAGLEGRIAALEARSAEKNADKPARARPRAAASETGSSERGSSERGLSETGAPHAQG